MTPFVYSLALLMLAALVAASTPPAATTCPARLFGLQASAARNSTGHENLKAVLQQPEGAAWHLDVAAEEQRTTGGERIRITTFALSADAEAAGEGGKGALADLEAKMATLTTQVAEQKETLTRQNATIVELRALVQGQRNGTSKEREDAAAVGGGKRALAELEAKMATQAAEQKERMRASDEELKAAIALLQRHLDATVAELKANNAALRGRPEAATQTPSTTTTSTTTTTRPLTSEELLAAAKDRRVEEMRALLAQGAGTEERGGYYQRTALHRAAQDGDEEIVKLLIAHGAFLEARDSFQQTPLYLAAGNGRTLCVEALLKAGAEVNARNYAGRTPLHYAAEYGYEAVVRLLLHGGADPSIRSNEGKTARDMARQFSNDTIRALLAA